MRLLSLTVIAIVFGAIAATAQQNSPAFPATTSGDYDVALGYNYIRANAPPGGCNCFSMNGGFIAGDFNLNNWFGITGKFTMGHAGDISKLGQDLTLSTFTAGPRFTYRLNRISVFGDVLVGGARGSGSYFPTSSGSSTSASSFAYSAGGGIDLPLSGRTGLRLVNAEYLHTGLQNGADNSQNQLEIGAGVIFRFSHRSHYVPPAPAASLPPQVQFSCSQSVEQVPVGEPLEIIGSTLTEPETEAVDYSWSASAGSVQGSGNTASVETTGLAPGMYHVYGRAALKAHPSVTSTCDVTFQVVPQPKEQVITRTIVQKESPAFLEELDSFNKNMKDAFFDVDKYDLRPDAQTAVQDDAQYLLAHPDMNITIAGYADERGTVEYNIMLGLQRALAVRKALAEKGVPMARMNVLSYGKEKQFCSTTTPDCYQLNRRAHMELNTPENQ